MQPSPTEAARLLAFALGLALIVGAMTSSVAVVSLASVGLLVLAGAFAATAPLARRARADRLEFAWWLGADPNAVREGAVSAGTPFMVHGFFRHRGAAHLRIARLEAVSALARTNEADIDRGLFVPVGRRAEFRLALVAPTAGRCVLQGMVVRVVGPLGLFELPLYFPNRLRLTVAPRRTRSARILGTPKRPAPRSTPEAKRRRGQGTDLRELRDLRPGDPFRTISWKTSARLGRLVVKEVEQEEHGTHRIVVDASPSMRDGTEGTTALDRALELALSAAEIGLAHGERVGVDVVDGRSLARLAPGDRPAQAHRVLETLIAANHVVDADRTDVDDAEVARRVARYVRHQEGIDFADGSREGVDAHALATQLASATLQGSPVAHATSEEGGVLRRYAAQHGIPLPYRRVARAGEKSEGLVEALSRMELRRDGPSRVTIYTDGVDLGVDAELTRAVRALVRHGHEVSFVLLPAARPRARERIASRIESLHEAGHASRVRELAIALRRLGARAETESRS